MSYKLFFLYFLLSGNIKKWDSFPHNAEIKLTNLGQKQ